MRKFSFIIQLKHEHFTQIDVFVYSLRYKFIKRNEIISDSVLNAILHFELPQVKNLVNTPPIIITIIREKRILYHMKTI